MSSPYCNKLPYPDRAVAEWYRPFREKKLGMRLWAYKCRNQACRPLRLWHLTSRELFTRGRSSAAKNFQRRLKQDVERWENEGGSIY